MDVCEGHLASTAAAVAAGAKACNRKAEEKDKSKRAHLGTSPILRGFQLHERI